MILENVRKRWDSIPEKARFVIVGVVGVAIGWIIYNIIYFFIPNNENRATVSWVIAYFFAIFRQHALHYLLTFRDSDSPYFESLLGAVWVYGIGWFLTTGVNSFLNYELGLNHQVAYFITVGSGVVYNYVFLKRVAFKDRVHA